MKIQSFIPQNAKLSKLVDSVHVIEHEETDRPESFLILPSISAYISVSLNTVSKTINDRTIVQQTSGNSFDSSLQFGLKSPCIFEYRGKIKEICVVFKPLGAYNFFDPDILLRSAGSDQFFKPESDYKPLMSRLLRHSEAIQISGPTKLS